MTEQAEPQNQAGPARPADDAPRCTCGHTKRDHSGRLDHREKHPNIPHRPWCHACETECIYCPPDDTEAGPIRKSLLPCIPPPEWEFSAVLGAPHGVMLIPDTDTGPVVVRRRVTWGDWEPVRPDRWADEEPTDTAAAERPAPAPVAHPTPCGPNVCPPTPETVHACPPGGSGPMPCCGRPVTDAGPTVRITENPAAVTCTAADNGRREQLAEEIAELACRKFDHPVPDRTHPLWRAWYEQADALLAMQAQRDSSDETARRFLQQRQEMAAERYAWQERGDRAEAAVTRGRKVADQIAAGAPWTANLEDTARRLHEALGPQTTEDPEKQRLREWLPVLRRAVDSLPTVCRYHGERLDPPQGIIRSEACCDTGVPARRRRQAEQALAALDPQEPS